jgi:hypothetical protein
MGERVKLVDYTAGQRLHVVAVKYVRNAVFAVFAVSSSAS